MSGLKEIRTRISSIKTTRQVTSAMKMVSAAKLKKAQDGIIHFRPYAKKLHEILDHLAGSMDCNKESPYCVVRDYERILIVVISSNRGLCGGFNSSIANIAEELILTHYSRQHSAGNVDILAIGKQGERQLKSSGMKPSDNRNNLWNNFSFESTVEIVDEIMKDFLKGRYDKVDLVYNEFVNAAVQSPVISDFLPVRVENKESISDSGLAIYEPSGSEIAIELVPMMLKTEFYKALLDSFASEHGARMTAMHMATDNATDLINELTLQYNKARQATITKEILEISAGAEALRG